MRHRVFFTMILVVLGISLLTGCAKKEEAPQSQAPVPQASAPAPESSAAPAPAASPLPAQPPAVPQKDKIREARQNFADAFDDAVRQGNGVDALHARIQAAENAKDACLKLRGEIDNPADLEFLNKFIDRLQDYSDKGHAYAAALEDADRLYAEIKKGQDALKDIPLKDQAEAITKINEKTIRYNDLFKTTLPKQRDEFEAFGKELLSMKK
jgi:hypothetical protein